MPARQKRKAFCQPLADMQAGQTDGVGQLCNVAFDHEAFVEIDCERLK
jgi:hypothetical protein